jgi:hypothetical protein
MSIFGVFGQKNSFALDPQVGRSLLWRMVILATYLKMGVDYEFDIKNNIWDIAVSIFQSVLFLQKLTFKTNLVSGLGSVYVCLVFVMPKILINNWK